MRFDPFAAEVIADPYPAYRELLRDGRPYRNDERDIWVLSRYDHVRAGARQHDVLSSAEGITYAKAGLPMMITMDPPDHTRLRRLVSRDFTPRAIESWQPMVERLVDELLSAAIERGACDLAADVFTPLPIMVIANVMGVPAEDRVQFKEWSDGVVEGFSLDVGESHSADPTRVMAGISGLAAYFTALFEERRTRPRQDDLVSKLMEPKDGEELTANELFWFCLLLLVAGNETTTNLLGNLFVALLANGDQFEALRSRPALVPSATEEALRYDPPLQGFFRTALTAYEVDDVVIPERSRVLLLYAAANRDPRHWEDPDRFLVDRAPDDHLAFTSGIHYCLGAGLARLEVATLLHAVLARTAHIELAGEIARTSNPTIHVGDRGILGVQMQSGTTVSGVATNSPAAAAGISAGDQIMSVDGTSVGSVTDIQRTLDAHHPGDEVEVRWTDSSGGTHTARIQLATGPPA